MYCYKCGKEISNESIYCQFCGTKVGKDDNDPRSKKALLESKVAIMLIAAFFLLAGCWIGAHFLNGDELPWRKNPADVNQTEQQTASSDDNGKTGSEDKTPGQLVYKYVGADSDGKYYDIAELGKDVSVASGTERVIKLAVLDSDGNVSEIDQAQIASSDDEILQVEFHESDDLGYAPDGNYYVISTNGIAGDAALIYTMDAGASSQSFDYEISISEPQEYTGGIELTPDGKIIQSLDLNFTGKLVVPDGVEKITFEYAENKYVEYTMANFSKIFIPASVTYIDSDVFQNNVLTEFIVAKDNPNYKSVDGVLYSKDGTALYSYPSHKEGSSYYVPRTVTHIYSPAFRYCEYLKDIYIPSSVTYFEMNTVAFSTYDLTVHCQASQKPTGWDDLFNEKGYSANPYGDDLIGLHKVLWGEVW